MKYLKLGSLFVWEVVRGPLNATALPFYLLFIQWMYQTATGIHLSFWGLSHQFEHAAAQRVGLSIYSPLSPASSAVWKIKLKADVWVTHTSSYFGSFLWVSWSCFYPLLSLREVRNNWQVSPRAFSEMKLLMNPYMLYNLWTQSALLPVPQLLCVRYPRVVSLGTLPDLKAGCWLWQSFTAVVRCCVQFLSLERSEMARLFQCYSKAASFFSN